MCAYSNSRLRTLFSNAKIVRPIHLKAYKKDAYVCCKTAMRLEQETCFM